MIDAVWVHVLARIPVEQYDNLAIITSTGAELVLQQIFKIERDFLVIRARTSGTGDLGRTIILPFDKIDFMALNKKMTEEEVLAIFGEPMPEVALPQAIAYQPATTTAPQAPSPPPRSIVTTTPAAATPAATTEPAAAETAATPKPGQISKTLLLARLRERLAEKAR